MRSLKIIILAVLTGFALLAQGDTFELVDGRSVSGELLMSSANDTEIRIKTGEGTYEKITWAEFSQSALKQLSQIPKLANYVEPFIEIPAVERIKKTEVKTNDVPHLDLPPKQNIVGALAGSSIGIFILILIYGANIYAGYEIACVRAYPPATVCAISAVVPFIGPIIYLCMPTRMQKPAEEEPKLTPAEEAAVAVASEADPASAPAHPGGLHFADEAATQAKNQIPETVVFQRGQFTFNRRFLETKFAGFFGMVRREADKDLHLIIKSARGEYDVFRINRISATDMHVEIHKGHASSEVVVPFVEIQEIQLKHKDAR